MGQNSSGVDNVELVDGSAWHPWHGPLRQPYRFRYREDREYRLHSAATGLLHHQLLDRHVLDWLSDYPSLWGPLLYALAGQYEHAGLLGELVAQADRASVAQALGGDPSRAMAAPRHALQRKLLDGLRHLLKEELKLNQPQASDGWLTEDGLWLVSKTVSDKLRAYLLSQGMDGIPANNTTVFNVLQEHGVLQSTPEDKAVWRATVTSTTGWSHTFTLLRMAPALIWGAAERPPTFSGTVTVDSTPTEQAAETADSRVATALKHSPNDQAPKLKESNASVTPEPVAPDVMQDMLALVSMSSLPQTPSNPHLETTENDRSETSVTFTSGTPPSPAGEQTSPANQLSGEHFMAWLKQSIASRRLIINDAKALVHTVDGTAYLVSPGIFQRYAQEHPQLEALAKKEKQQDWQWVQKRFEKLRLHRKQDSGLNIWTCNIIGPRKSRRLHGYLLDDATLLFTEAPPNNPYLSLAKR